VANNKVSESKSDQAMPDRFLIQTVTSQDNEHILDGVKKQNQSSKVA